MRSMKLAGLVLLLGCGGCPSSKTQPAGPQVKWQVYEHTCQGKKGFEVITSVSFDQLRYLVAATKYSEMQWTKERTAIVSGKPGFRYLASATERSDQVYECDCGSYDECRLSLAFLD